MLLVSGVFTTCLYSKYTIKALRLPVTVHQVKHTYTHARTHTRMYAHTHTHTHTYTHTHSRIQTHTLLMAKDSCAKSPPTKNGVLKCYASE